MTLRCTLLLALVFAACDDGAAPIFFIGGDVTAGDVVPNDAESDAALDTASDTAATDPGADTDPDMSADHGGDGNDGDGGSDAEPETGDATDARDARDTADSDRPDGGVGEELCDNGDDDDGDGDIDCLDADCEGVEPCLSSCGDGILDPDEACEDGNEEDGDGCSAYCTLEDGFINECGDGVVVAGAGEECDDGNDAAGDGCELCQLAEPAVCGDAFWEPDAEECDAGEGCDFDETCTESCLCAAADCGDGEVDGGEECDGPGDECGPDSFCNDACSCEAYVCGDGEVDGTEECDGPGIECDPDSFCNDACSCEAYVCGDDVADGVEECDGVDLSGCDGGEICNDDCACEAAPAGPPLLDALPGDLLGGPDPALEILSWATADFCTERFSPHGLSLRLTGSSSAALRTVTIRITGVDSAAREFDVTGVPGGDFSFLAEVCLDTLPEGRAVRTTVIDSVGRESDWVEWTFPALDAATLTSVEPFVARNPDVHVFRLRGDAPDRNIKAAYADLLDSTGASIADAYELGLTLAVFAGGDSYGAVGAIGGVDGLDLVQYDARALTYGGELSALRTGMVADTPGTVGDDCIPSYAALQPTCALPLVCREATDGVTGRCSRATGSPPVLTRVEDGRFEAGSPFCPDTDFPNAVLWTVVGSSSELITSVTIAAPEFGDGTFPVAIAPIGPGSFSEVIGICLSFRPATVTTAVVDEAGRTSEERVFNP